MSGHTSGSSVRVLAALALCMALQMTGAVMILPLFARRFESFGAGVAALGMSAMAFALAGVVAAPVIGLLADRFGRRPVILLSLAAYVLAFGGYLGATSAGLLILLRGLAGGLTAGLVPTMTSVVGDVAAEQRRAQWIGIVNGGASIGWIAGPVLGGLLYDRYGYGVAVGAAMAMAGAALLLALVLIPETGRRGADARRPRAVGGGWQGLRGGRLGWLMLISFGVMFAWAFIEPQFMFYAYDALAWSSSQLGLVMSAYGLACAFGEFTLGRLSDRLGRQPVLALGLALFSAQFIGLVMFHDAAWIVASFVVAGLGNALYDPALSAAILDITPRDQTARMMGLKATAGSLGSMLGPGLVVLVAPLVGPQVVFLIAAVLSWMLALTSGPALRSARSPEAAQGGIVSER